MLPTAHFYLSMIHCNTTVIFPLSLKLISPLLHILGFYYPFLPVLPPHPLRSPTPRNELVSPAGLVLHWPAYYFNVIMMLLGLDTQFINFPGIHAVSQLSVVHVKVNMCTYDN